MKKGTFAAKPEAKRKGGIIEDPFLIPKSDLLEKRKVAKSAVMYANFNKGVVFSMV